MASYQEIVDNVRNFLGSMKPGHDAAVAESAEEYARLCREANERLRRCMDALRHGLRGDAIQMADAEPNLLDLVAGLDFPEFGQWTEACVVENWPVPPKLLIEAAAAINEAYADEQPLDGLLAHHRLMALARAPLPERLMVMRRLAELDAASTFWNDDIQKMETVRLEEMRTQMRKAVETDNAGLATRLCEEIGTSKWRVTVTNTLQKSLRESADQLVAKQGIAELRKLRPPLNEAYAALAYEQCKQQMEQWDAIVTTAKVTVPPDLAEQVETIRGWLNEEDQKRAQKAAHGEACNILQQAIDTDQPTPALERAYQTAIRFPLELPSELEARYQQRLVARARAARHRRWLIYTGIAAAFLLIAGALTLVTYQVMRSRELSEAEKTLAQVLTEVKQGEIAKGEAVRKQLVAEHPRILHSPLITKALADIDSAIAAEHQRQADFKQHLDLAVAGGVEHPDEAELKKAGDLARRNDETAQIQDFQDHLAEYRARIQQEIDQKFTADGAALAAEIAQKLSPQNLIAHAEDYAHDIDSLTLKVNTLRQRGNISEQLKTAQLTSLDAVIHQEKQALDRYRTQQGAIEHIRHFGHSAQEHVAALKQFMDSCPDDPRCTDLKRAAGQLLLAQAVEDWAELCKGWPMNPLKTCEMAKVRAAEVEKYLARYPETPMAEPAKAYLDYLKKGVQIASETGPWKTSLSALLALPVIHDLYYLDDASGRRWYVSGNVKVDESELPGVGKTQIFQAVTAPDLTTTKITLKTQEGNLLNAKDPRPSPQHAFADKANEKLEKLDFSNWEGFGDDILADLLAQKDIDPVLQGILVERILDMNQAATDWCGQSGFSNVAKDLSKQNVGNIAWLDPRSPPDKFVVSKIQGSVVLLRPLPESATIHQHSNEVIRNAQLNLAGEGILFHSGDGYEIVTQSNIAAGMVAYAIGADKRLVQIGQYNDKAWTIESSNARDLPEGSLVFIVSPPQ